MCGIAGELRLDVAPSDLSVVKSMLPALARRGPNDKGTFSDGALTFGHRRLSIIDLSDLAHQPMEDKALSQVLVFNGTIYNYPELREELIGLGYSFRSHGNTEVIIKAWHAWGLDSVNYLIGMFAFAIWDQNTQQLHLARDRLA